MEELAAFVVRLTAVDLLLIVIWLAAIAYGWISGIVRQIFVLAAILLGAVMGWTLAWDAAFWTGLVSGLEQRRLNPLTYTIITIAVAAVLYYLTTRAYRHTRLAGSKWLDQWGGGLLGIIAGLLSVMLLAGMLDRLTRVEWLLLDITRINLRLQMDNSPFVPLLGDLLPPVRAFVDSLLPLL